MVVSATMFLHRSAAGYKWLQQPSHYRYYLSAITIIKTDFIIVDADFDAAFNWGFNSDIATIYFIALVFMLVIFVKLVARPCA